MFAFSFFAFIRQILPRHIFVIASLISFSTCQITYADSLTERQQAIEKLVAQGIDPIIADCAAHAAYIVPTFPHYRFVEFSHQALIPPEAIAKPWHKSFDNKKQKTLVDTMVVIEGLAHRQSKEIEKRDKLEIRCGYVDNLRLAFSYSNLTSNLGEENNQASKKKHHKKHAKQRNTTKKSVNQKKHNVHAHKTHKVKRQTR